MTDSNGNTEDDDGGVPGDAADLHPAGPAPEDETLELDASVGRPTRCVPPNDLFREPKIAMVKIGQIEKAPRRIRRSNARQIEAVKDSMRRFGCRLPILIDRKFEVIDGHIRLEAARQLGAEAMACITVDDLPDHEVRRLALSLNKLQEVGEWDDDVLKLEVGELIEIASDISFPGFEFQEIEAIRFGEIDDEGADPLDDVSGFGQGDQPPVTQTGDLWILGDHRLLCGSARDAGAFDRLLGGTTVRMVLTDSPFNLRVSGLRVAIDFPEFREASGGFCQNKLA